MPLSDLTIANFEHTDADTGLRLRGVSKTLSLSEQIAGKICDAILKNEYKPGSPIGEQVISNQFGVSRGPVRDALRILEAEGLVEIIPRRGARVTDLTIREVDQLYEIRAVLLGLSSRLLARHRPPEAIEELEMLFNQLEKNFNKKNDFENHFQISSQLNLVIVTRSGNEKLSSMILKVARQVARYQRLGISTADRRAESLEGWRKIINAIISGDEDGAERLQRIQVKKSHDKILELMMSQFKLQQS